MKHTKGPWYTVNTGNHQGLVLSESNGANVQEDTMRYTYNYQYEAMLGLSGDNNRTAIVPDQVADNQRDYDGKTFPAINKQTGRKIRVRLIGDYYGLYSPGTGDMIVRRS
jgi:hypothetical protein